jgi:hypothetical protein
MRRKTPRNTIVEESTLWEQVVDNEDAIVAASNNGALVTLSFAGASAMQAVRSSKADVVQAVVLSPTVKFGVRRAGLSIEIFHIEEGTTDVGLASEEQFPSLLSGAGAGTKK